MSAGMGSNSLRSRGPRYKNASTTFSTGFCSSGGNPICTLQSLTLSGGVQMSLGDKAPSQVPFVGTSDGFGQEANLPVSYLLRSLITNVTCGYVFSYVDTAFLAWPCIK